MRMITKPQSYADGSGQCGEEAWSLAGAEELRTDEAIKRLRSIAVGHRLADGGEKLLHAHQRRRTGEDQIVVL